MTYLRLIWLYYESEKPLPLDAATLAFKTGSDESTVTMILSAFFKRSDNGWIQMRCESEIRQYQAKAESARNANRARWSDSSMKSDKKSDKESYPNQEPITNNHKPITNNQKPKNQEPSSSDDAKASRLKNVAVWESYEKAYFNKYGVDPVRNAKVNSQISQLRKRLGDDAVHVAGWFLTHRNGWYTQKMHSLDCLLNDAEKLRTEWATNTQMTNAHARTVDKSTGGGNVFLKLINEGYEP